MFGLRSAGALVASLGVVAAVAVAAPATADPNGQVITVTCDNGHTYMAVVAGGGEFTPAHDTASNTVLIPTAFGESTVVVRDSTGKIIDTETQPPVSKGSARPPVATSTSCTYSGTFDDVTEDGTPVTVSVTGTVSGFVTPVG